MSEYIERDKLGADFELCNKQNPRWTPQRVASLIARANAADVVEVVRCKECKHRNPENAHCDHPMGTTLPVARKPDDFCSYGERKENNHD